MHSTSSVNHDNRRLLAVLHSTLSSEPPLSTSIRIIDLINERIHNNTPFYGIEVCPTVGKRSDPVLDLSRFANPPLFVSITWLGQHFDGPENIASTPALQLLKLIRADNDDGHNGRMVPVLLHITCERMTADAVLQAIGDNVVHNVLALRGDHVQPDQPMQHASDLLQHIRQHRPVTCVAIAGYPQAPDADTDLQYLLKKCAAGADFIITQVCFSASAILRFVARCRHAGCHVPIVIGLYVPASHAELLVMLRICGIITMENDGSAAVERQRYDELANDPVAFQAYAVRETRRRMELLLAGGVVGFHFFTLNRFELVQRCVEGFGF